MLVPASIFSYYPNYQILDDVLSRGKYNNLNIFIDLKNNMQTIYFEHAIQYIVDMTLKMGRIDTSVFASILPFLSFHRLYALKREIDVNFYIFFETGESYYHKNISKKYKISRQIDDLYGLDKEKRDLFHTVLHKNWQFIEKAYNLMPNVKVIRLENLEADFIPYYLTTRNIVDTSESTCNLLYSNDHDMFQFCGENRFIYRRSAKKKEIITEKDIMLKECDNGKLDGKLQPLLMSIVGDVGDDVFGIKGIGPKTAAKILPEIVDMVGGIENLYNNVILGNDIFDLKIDEHPNKNINKVIECEKNEKLISNNLKLVSFELLSREFDNPSKLEILNKRNKMLETLNSNKIAKYSVMLEALQKNNVEILDDSLQNIYFEKNNVNYLS